MRRTATVLLATAVLAGVGPLDAQERDAGAWWAPAVHSLMDQAARAVAQDGDGTWWERAERRRQERQRDDGRYEERDGDGDTPWWGRTDPRDDDDDDRYEDDRYDDDDRYARDGRRGAKKGNGPPFCRNGQGHPKHGMRWCAEKGWTNGGAYDRARRDGTWSRTGWEDVILRGPAPTRERRVTQPSVADVLGDVVFGRLAEHGLRQGLDGVVDGRWLSSRAGSVLQLRMGGVPLAELTDANRDGRVDVVLLRNR